MQLHKKFSIYQHTSGERKEILKEREKVDGIFGIRTLNRITKFNMNDVI